MSTITGIPAAEVGRVVQDFIDDGEVRLVVEQAADGTYTVTVG